MLLTPGEIRSVCIKQMSTDPDLDVYSVLDLDFLNGWAPGGPSAPSFLCVAASEGRALRSMKIANHLTGPSPDPPLQGCPP